MAAPACVLPPDCPIPIELPSTLDGKATLRVLHAVIPNDNRAAIASIAREHGQSVRRFVASRLRYARNAVDDIVQEVYLRLIRRGEQEVLRNPEAYLIQIAAHTLHDLGYGCSREERAADALPVRADESGQDDTEQAADAQQRLERVEHLLEQLPPRIRASFLLYRVHGLSHHRIGETLRVHPNTVKNDIKAAASHLSRHFGKDAP